MKFQMVPSYLDDTLNVEQQQFMFSNGEKCEGNPENDLNSIQEEAVHDPGNDIR